MPSLIERVIRHLEKTRGEWCLKAVDGEKRLLRRVKEPACCPLDHLRPNWRHNYVMKAFVGEGEHWNEPMNQEEAAIVDAADGMGDPALRARMLEAAGLAEESSS